MILTGKFQTINCANGSIKIDKIMRKLLKIKLISKLRKDNE